MRWTFSIRSAHTAAAPAGRSGGDAPAMAFTSPPAQKAPPAPVTTKARTDSSRRASTSPSSRDAGRGRSMRRGEREV